MKMCFQVKVTGTLIDTLSDTLYIFCSVLEDTV